jgi:hypothetical protein
MSHDAGNHCFFARQPNTKLEIDAAILALNVSCCGAVRYGGQNRELLIRLAELGEVHCCDYQLDDEPKPANISHASFGFALSAALNEGRATIARNIMEYLAGWLMTGPSRDHRVVDFHCSETSSSFRYEWGYGGTPNLFSETFALEPDRAQRWLLRISRKDHRLTAPVRVHEAMQHDTRFRNVRWFTEEEWQQIGVTGGGRLLPY